MLVTHQILQIGDNDIFEGVLFIDSECCLIHQFANVIKNLCLNECVFIRSKKSTRKRLSILYSHARQCCSFIVNDKLLYSRYPSNDNETLD
jgi:hypothetical protein